MFIDSRDLRLLIAQGLNVSQIARELNVHPHHVRRTANICGIQLPTREPIEKAARTSVFRDRAERVQALAEQGKNMSEIASEMGVCYSYVSKIAAVNEIAVGRKGQAAREERAEKMVRMYRQGLTGAQIGEYFGITRERVRQILKKQRVIGDHGGARKRAEARKSAKSASMDARALLKWGMTHAEASLLRKAGITIRYERQRNSAHQRGINWELNLAQWWGVWQASGKWDQRGRGKGKYCMSRIKDSGGYVVGNVHIQLATENSAEATKKWIGRTKQNRGVFFLLPGLDRPYLAKVGKVSLGRFASEEEAVAARLAYVTANGLPPHRYGLKAA